MPDTLIDAARDGDLTRVTRDIDSLSESERRRFAAQALKLLRAVREAYVGRVLDKPWPYGEDQESVLRATQVLVLGTATGAELRKVGPWGVPPTDLAFETLTHRPTVVADLVDAIADNPPVRWNSGFRLMRSLVRAGHVGRPTNPGYILAMINGLEIHDVSVYDALVADPGLLENEVWRVFEVEGAGETSLAAHDKYSLKAQTWSTALEKLSVEGKLPRARLLDASLAALRRDFAPFRAGWFSRFHEQLAPTPDERREREDGYVALLSSPVPATVSFAVRALLAAGSMSDAYVDRLAPALMSKATATVKGAIRLLPKTERGAAVAVAAVPHATRDGQPALLAFIKGIRPDLAPAPAASIPERQFEPPAPPTLAGPVESVAELVELLATLLEHIEDAHEIERALEATSRLCARDGMTLQRLDAVGRRAAKVQSEMRAFAGESPRADLAGLVIAWATGRVPPVPLVPGLVRSPFLMARRDVPGPRKSVLGFLSARVLEVASRAARGQREPILSLPTSAGGAIDPEMLASRRNELARLRIKPAKADAIQAALRAGEVRPRTAVRFRYESPTAKHFELVVDPTLKTKPDLDDVPGLFVGALSAVESGPADYNGIGRNGVTGLAEAVRWVGTVWPANRELFYAKGAMDLGRNVDWWQAMWHVRAFLEPLLLPTESIREMGRLLVALGLGAKEPGERALATDVFVTGVGQGRLDAHLLGQTLGELYDHEVVKAGRVASALADASRVSHGHEEAVADTVEGLLAVMHGPPPPDLHALLGVLSDALTSLNRSLSHPDASAYLSGVEGTGKAATNAKALLAQGRHSSRD